MVGPDAYRPARVQWIATRNIIAGEQLFAFYDKESLLHPGVSMQVEEDDGLICNAELLIKYYLCLYPAVLPYMPVPFESCLNTHRII